MREAKSDIYQEWPAGRTVVEVRMLTAAEADRHAGWDEWQARDAVVMILDDGSMLFPSQDHEGNGSGALFGVDPSGKDVTVIPAPLEASHG